MLGAVCGGRGCRSKVGIIIACPGPGAQDLWVQSREREQILIVPSRELLVGASSCAGPVVRRCWMLVIAR